MSGLTFFPSSDMNLVDAKTINIFLNAHFKVIASMGLGYQQQVHFFEVLLVQMKHYFLIPRGVISVGPGDSLVEKICVPRIIRQSMMQVDSLLPILLF